MWTYKNKNISTLDDLPEEAVGFIYKITNTLDGRYYIGKKILKTSRRVRISKKEKALTKTRKIFKIVVKESDWKTYTGSSVELNNDIKKLGINNFKFEILEVACNKKYMTYCEARYQFENRVLENNSYNYNILGKIFPKDTNNCYGQD